MGNGLARVALWALVVLMLAGSSLASIAGAWATSPTAPNYTLQGYVDQPGGIPVPAGVTVELISSGSHQVFKTTTSANSGQFSFTNFPGGGNTGGALSPGWWGLWVPPQSGLKLSGCNPCAILPGNQNPTYYNESGSNLTSSSYQVTIGGISRLPFDSMLKGNVTLAAGGKAQVGASVQLLAPLFNNFVLANNTTTTGGYYTLPVPSGSWVLQSTISGSPNQFAFNNLTLASNTLTVNPAIGGYFTYGSINLASSPSSHVPNGGNVTVYDPVNHFLYSQAIPGGGFYDFGTYPAGFAGGGANTFDVILSPVGYSTAWYPLTVSGGSQTGGPNPHNVLVSPMAPPASYATTLNFSQGFGVANVTSTATLLNDSVFPDLPNASVGQLWAQLALDTQHNLTFVSSASLPWVYNWAASQGPFFPAGQNQLLVNMTGFNQTTNGTWTNSTNCPGLCGLGSSAWLKFSWAQKYWSNGTVGANAKTYPISFEFRHPTNGQSINYTVVLPTGYALSANNPVPAQTKLVPAGPGGAWTSFTLVSKPSSSPSGTATLTAVKYGAVTAIINITSSNFAYSTKNVINQTRNSYTVIAGTGQSLTFSALNSTFLNSTNGTAYEWHFGDSASDTNTTTPTTTHTYASFGSYAGWLKVSSSGGLASTTTFTVLAGSTAPKAIISVNATVNTTAGGAQYVIVNWSKVIHFNATLSTSTIYPSAPKPGVISVAYWTATATKFSRPANFSWSANANPGNNFTLPLLGAGLYWTNGSVNGTLIPFKGWQYNISLTVWDSGGHKATASMTILVRDTQEPVAVAGVVNSQGRSVASTGVTEGVNHTALVYFWGNGSNDPGNGSVVQYSWNLTNKGNTSIHLVTAQTATSPGYAVPAKFPMWLDPQSKAYTMNLTVTDRAGNKEFNVATLTVAVNATTRPVLQVGNLTGPSAMTDGTSYTIWVNVTNALGKNSTALGVAVWFYIQSPSGSGQQYTIGGGPSQVTFYNYTNGTGALSSIQAGKGSVSLKWNQTVRAVISFTPGRTGSFWLWANATATNEFPGSYSGINQMHVSVTLNPNPLVQLETYGVIAGVAALIIVGLVIYYRRRVSKPAGKSGRSSSGSDRGKKDAKPRDDDKDDEEEDE